MKGSRDEKIIELRKQNWSYKDIANEMQISESLVSYVSHKYGLNGKRSSKVCQNHRNGSHKKSEQEVALFVKDRLNDFEYVTGYNGSESTITIRCLRCGTEQQRSMVTIRHRNVKCQVCYQNSLEDIQNKKNEVKKQNKRNKKYAGEPTQVSMKICPVCGNTHLRKGGYCSERCYEIHRWRMKDAYRYMFPLEEVFERDKGICYICGKPCDWGDYKIKNDVIIYGNAYPSRDHVIPKSKGGKNEWSNIRLAHRLCNSQKHTSLGQNLG